MKNNILLVHMDYIFFFYGASFIILGAVCFAILRRSADVKRLPWLWLGLFGFIHGLNEWMDMVAISLGDSFWFRVARLVVMISSFVCLMEFARRGHSEFLRRRITASFYPWLFILASMGFWAGWEGLNASCRYCFGLTSALWSAFVIFSFLTAVGKSLNRFSFFSLKIAATALLLYGLGTGLIVPKAGFFPASLLNQDSFISVVHLPVQFFRAIFAFAMAISVALYAINQSMTAFLREEPAKEKRFVIASLGSVVIILVLFYSGWEIVDHYSRQVATEEMGTRSLRVKIFSQFIHASTKKLEAVEALAGSPEMPESILSLGKNQAAMAVINEHLDRYRDALEADVCYLMDMSGLTIASSNRNSPKSFVGKNYSFRPYFQDALKGGRGIYMAKGVTSNERGIYVSYPVFDDSRGRILGVAVAKATLDNLEEYFRTYQYIFLISPEGIIFVSSKPEWIFRSVSDLTPEQKESLRESRQFGDGPWDSIGLDVLDEKAGTALLQNTRFFFVTENVEGVKGWKIYYLDAMSNVAAVRLMLIMIFLSFFLLISIVILFTFRISLDTLHLSASEALYEALVEGSPDSILLLNRDGRCVSINKNGLALMGCKKDDVVGKPFEDLWPAEYKEKIAGSLKSGLEGRPQVFEARMLRCDGTTAIETVTLAPIFEVSGEIKYFISTCRDITEERRSRERLLQSSKMATVGSLATGVSHEFNNVLEIILGNAELAYASKDPETMKKALKVIIDSARRAAWIVKSMLDFSGRPLDVREFVDVGELLKQNLVLLGKVFEANGIEIETHFKETPRIYCNSSQLSQAFVNIMMNSREAMRGLDEKRLIILLDHLADSSEVAVSFQDTGVGIKENIKSKLFGPFVTTKGILGGGDDKQPGVGLGLFVAYGIIKQHNGNITVESEEGKGAKFTVFLPIFPGEEKLQS